MDYQTFLPHPDLAALVKCYWTLQVAATGAARQRIIPDGCIEMAFILGDDIKRYTSENEYILQPRAMVLGQITGPFYIEPTGYVHSFAIRFYPYGFANFVQTPIKELADKETPLSSLFDAGEAEELESKMIASKDTKERIETIECFLLDKLRHTSTVDHIVKSTIDTLFSTKGNAAIRTIIKDDLSRRRQLERKFLQQIGLSPKQLGKVIRLQAAIHAMINETPENLSGIAYDSDYYDQSHFIRDFKEFTGATPREFLGSQDMALSKLFYKKV
ncbi:MAG TPA: helix-turn-helix domain-containing protein [Cytophagales bacterium]|nr:helix-turn-helix domain-containing protein [Cytophagales bacterium]